MIRTRAITAATFSAATILLAGCDQPPPICDNERVKPLVTELTDEMAEKGLSPKQKNVWRSLRTMSVVSTAETVQKGSKRVCQAKVAFKFSEPLTKKLQSALEGQDFITEWSLALKTDMGRVLECAFSGGKKEGCDDLLLLKFESHQDAEHRIKLLRDVWNDRTNSIEANVVYTVTTNDKGNFSVSLLAPGLVLSSEFMPVIFAASALSATEAKRDQEKARQASSTNSVSTPVSQTDVPLTRDMDYRQAREMLKKSGWMPDYVSPDTLGPVARARYDEGFPEVASCADTGLAQCKFEWTRNNSAQSLTVQTVGEEPKVAAWTLR
jgi:hypothetical protein